MRQTLLVAAGGMVGSVARFWVSSAAQRLSATSLPVGTLLVNVAGSFLAGVVMALWAERGTVGEPARLLVVTGFCGGFTTMSAFAYDSVALFRGDATVIAAGNVIATLALSLGAAWAGYAVGRAA